MRRIPVDNDSKDTSVARFDMSPLARTVSASETAAYRDASLASGLEMPQAPRVQIAQGVFIAIGGLIALGLGLLGPGTGSAFNAVIVVILVVVGIGLLVIAGGAVASGVRARGRRWQGLVRSTRFARENGLDFVPASTTVTLLGTIFRIGSDRHSYYSFTSTSTPHIAFGNHDFFADRSGKGLPTTWGFVMIERPEPLPHVILAPVSPSRRGFFALSLLERSPSGDARFELFHPKGSSIEARAVFSPALLDFAAQHKLAIEAVEGAVWVYATKWFSFPRRSAFTQVSMIIDAVDAGILAPGADHDGPR